MEPRSCVPQLFDLDPLETAEWVEALDGVLRRDGPERARFLLRRVLCRAEMDKLGMELIQTPYMNTIPPEEEPEFPGDEWMEKRIRRIVRWNAMAMVSRANSRFPGIGGHISTYASAASLYEVGFNHFFRARTEERSGDHVFFQGHAAPGIYSRAFLEGRLSEESLDHFRRETEEGGLPSYCHPRRLPDFWEFPTVSMGLGPLNAIYQARFNRYLMNRGLRDTAESRVWCFVGDGETDEPESLGSLHLAANEELDNLIFVVNCNLQRLDGPVRGNGKIIQELEAVFRGSGWRVIKVVLGREWDELLKKDETGALLHRLNTTVDGWFQRYSVEGPAFVREHFFGGDERLAAMARDLTDEQIWHLRRGGHDYRKVYAAFARAAEPTGRPTAILVKTVKGWALGEGFEGKNVTHQLKKLNVEQLRAFRDKLELPIPDDELEKTPPYYHPGEESEEVRYLKERRRALGGSLPARRISSEALPAPEEKLFAEFGAGTPEGQEVSTTMAFARILRALVRDEKIGKRIVPIVPDEARTFGLDALFKEVGIYAQKGQLYEPVDHNLLLRYREEKNGQILEEGITEAGAMGSFTAAGTSYATHGLPMIPFYVFYSMFGFQRTGDLIWSFGDQKGRGFLLGATAGRTTLAGEGLQHNDGHSHLTASTIPNIRAYDPAFAYELAAIVREGIAAMAEREEDCFYYITLYNENYRMPPMPEGAERGIVEGIHPVRATEKRGGPEARLVASGAILREALAAAEILEERYGVSARVWSATSWQRLRADALAVERRNLLRPEKEEEKPLVTRALEEGAGPIVAVSDWVRAVPEMIARWAPGPFRALGTDGYGLSGTREGLRRHFEVDAAHIACAALAALAREGTFDAAAAARAREELGIDPDRPDPIGF
ncbi:MAG: pyruvate dehydrogenase (acetyl-transferring), homodimeric type [Candidatus Eisenbacteria bacterium]|nr:pyruvate dehydrogenase (acetyl-transferring), homodimeric type [Candidatus Eisenbacteria bacterium]